MKKKPSAPCSAAGGAGVVQQLHKARDPRALTEHFYRTLYPLVYYTVYRLTRGQVEVAQDITHEAFVRFLKYQGLDRVNDDAQAAAYLRQIARRLFADHCRETQRELSIDPATLAGSAESSEAEPVYDDSARAELIADIERLSTQVSEGERALLEMLLAGSSIEKIAASLRLSYGATAVRIHRLRKKLVEAMA